MNTDNYITILQEWIMQFGLYEVTACVAFVVAIWQASNIINAITAYRKQSEKDKP